MKLEKINIIEKFELFHNHWSPRVIAEMNGYQFKLVKIQGEFVWHKHSDTDEVFIVIEGNMSIEFRHKMVELNAGDMLLVPKGVEHMPFSEYECKVMLVEPKGVVNTGDADGELTAENNIWV